LFQALSEELLKLKSASEKYEETKQNLQKMCESIDKISQTHKTLTNNIRQALVEMEKSNAKNQQTQKVIKSLYEETKNHFESELKKHEEVMEVSMSKKFNEVSNEFGKGTERIRQDHIKNTKSLRIVTALIGIGVVLEVIIIIRMFLF
jgi:hypothetical protein